MQSVPDFVSLRRASNRGESLERCACVCRGGGNGERAEPSRIAASGCSTNWKWGRGGAVCQYVMKCYM
jgi:hypothetical protein